MNDVLRFLNSHSSVRQFTSEEITAEQEDAIVHTAERSPTSSNLHAYSIITVRDDTTKKQLTAWCGNQAHVAQSSLFLVFCADLHRLSQFNETRGYAFNGEYTESFVIATVDASLVAARALMAAQALGLGGVMVGGIRNKPEEVRQLLGLPKLTYPVMGMSLGHPAKQPDIKPRLPIDGLCFSETYNQEQIVPAVDDYDDTIAAMGYLQGREVEPEAYPGFSGRYSWSEHTARRMASTAPGAQRPHLLKFLQGQGFLKK